MFGTSTLGQIFPGTPSFTEKDVADQKGKVFIVTGSNTGIGKEVARVLYSMNASVWVAARDEEKSSAAIESIKAEHPSSSGKLEYLHLDLSDLTTIKKSVEAFMSKEEKLNVLFNNAGVMMPPPGSLTAQGYDLQLGTNCVGAFLFTRLLQPILSQTAKTAPKNSTRVVWVSSSAAELLSPKNGVDFDFLDASRNDKSTYSMLENSRRYGISKAGNYYHATEFAKRYPDIISVALNPGNLKSDLDRHVNFVGMVFRYVTTYPTIYGASTELFAGLSDEVTVEKSGAWIVPWGRFSEIRKDLQAGSSTKHSKSVTLAEKFWKWSEEQVKEYLYW